MSQKNFLTNKRILDLMNDQVSLLETEDNYLKIDRINSVCILAQLFHMQNKTYMEQVIYDSLHSRFLEILSKEEVQNIDQYEAILSNDTESINSIETINYRSRKVSYDVLVFIRTVFKDIYSKLIDDYSIFYLDQIRQQYIHVGN